MNLFIDGEVGGLVVDRLQALGYVVQAQGFAIGRPDHPAFPVRTPDGQAAVVKIYPPGGALAVFERWQAVWSSSFGERRTPPGLPKPLACVRNVEALVTEYFPGQPLAAMPIGEADFEAAVRLIAELHCSDAQPVRRRSSRGILRSLNRKLEFVKSAAPQHAEMLGQLLARLVAIRPSREDLVPSHGDCSPRNFLVGDNRLVLIDWDRLQWADPARDLTYFGLWNWKQDLRQGRLPNREPLERALAIYEACRPQTQLRPQLRFHIAAGLVRQAVSVLLLWPAERSLVPQLLGLAMRELE